MTPPADRARKLLALALRSESDKEAVSAFKKARKLAQEHQLHDLLQEQPVPAAARVGEAAARAAGERSLALKTAAARSLPMRTASVLAMPMRARAKVRSRVTTTNWARFSA